jgi:hypothetical protein
MVRSSGDHRYRTSCGAFHPASETCQVKSSPKSQQTDSPELGPKTSSLFGERCPQTSNVRPEAEVLLSVQSAEFVAMPFVRHCVECSKCLTRYLIAFSPYRNGSYLWRQAPGSSDEYFLYCFCQQPPVFNNCKERDFRTCLVSKAAHARGYGTPAEIVVVEQVHAPTRRLHRA